MSAESWDNKIYAISLLNPESTSIEVSITKHFDMYIQVIRTKLYKNVIVLKTTQINISK